MLKDCFNTPCLTWYFFKTQQTLMKIQIYAGCGLNESKSWFNFSESPKNFVRAFHRRITNISVSNFECLNTLVHFYLFFTNSVGIFENPFDQIWLWIIGVWSIDFKFDHVVYFASFWICYEKTNPFRAFWKSDFFWVYLR